MHYHADHDQFTGLGKFVDKICNLATKIVKSTDSAYSYIVNTLDETMHGYIYVGPEHACMHACFPFYGLH